jgi:murein L,D-transpeptidase YcbB/YkuD
MVVKDFQNKNGLTVDGEVGVNTAKKLIELIKPLSTVDDKNTKISTLTSEETKKIEDEVKSLIEKENTKPTPTQEQLTQVPTEEQIKKLTEEVEKDKTEEFNNIGSYEEFRNIFKVKQETEKLKTLSPTEIKLK